ncbi:hypothetical protein G9U51_10760 [Calidifontibacter sp. DB0510]|uniref:Uncharacterized protein n=1 Tax=Metallococcus carri TaxID=1656884 RepID=A0A967B2M4_9MICO|nr:hypothetical protein [Metallococcus carri]NHN56255.1 hypothetical protein [Metallococcus carri]NOP38693.1 hypothetical protein [Calidifontibacter sp. DB2511S]
MNDASDAHRAGDPPATSSRVGATALTGSPHTGRVRRNPAPWWWALAVAVPVVLGFAGAQANAAQMERTITQRAQTAIAGSGIDGAKVRTDGRDVTVSVPADADGDKAEQAVSAIPGVRTVVVKRVTP